MYRTTRFRIPSFALGALVTLFLMTCPALSQQPNPVIPGLLDLGTVKIEIHDELFVKELVGVNATYKETETEKYRGLVLTLRITKPPEATLTLYAQDLSLHYRRAGADMDVARCTGLSSFSASTDTDRPMNLYRAGLGKVTTGIATQKAPVVYVDAFFQYMEPDTKDLYLLVAQPVGLYFQSAGWSK